MSRAESEEDLSAVRDYYSRILPFYELECVGRQDLAFWRRLARERRARSVLEIGAGLGRVTAALAPFAEIAVGLDTSLELLARAGRSRAGSGARFVGGDARRLPLARTFDLVVAPGDPFSHLLGDRDRRRGLAEVARVLEPGGQFALEGLYRIGRAPWRRGRSVRLADGRRLAIAESWRPEGSAALWRATFRYRLRGPDGTRETEASFVARAWEPEELAAGLEKAGFAIEETWGGFAREPFRPDSRRIVVLAVRPKR